MDGQSSCACIIAPGTTLTLRRHASSDGYTARVIADGSAFVLTASLAAETCELGPPALPAGAGPAAAAGAGSPVAAAHGAACALGAPVCSQRTALRVTTADGAWVQADTGGAVTMVQPPPPGPRAGALEEPQPAGPDRAWRVVLPGGTTARGWADGRVRVLHPDGSASLRLPRGWGPGQVSGFTKGSGQPDKGAWPADKVIAGEAVTICGWAAALLSGSTWPPRADLLSDASPELKLPHTPSKLAPLPAAVWVRTNSGGQRWAELDPLEALSIPSTTPPPPSPPPVETPEQPVVPAPGAPMKPPPAKAGAQSTKAASPPGTGKASGASLKPAGEEKAADGKAQAAGAAAPRRSVEPGRSALQAAAAQNAPVDAPVAAEQPPPLATRWLLLPPVPTEGALDADTGCQVRARADGVFALAYPNGDRLVQDADGARVEFMPESWAAEAAGCPAVTCGAAGMQVRAHAHMKVYKTPCASCILHCVSSKACGAVLPYGELTVLATKHMIWRTAAGAPWPRPGAGAPPRTQSGHLHAAHGRPLHRCSGAAGMLAAHAGSARV